MLEVVDNVARANVSNNSTQQNFNAIVNFEPLPISRVEVIIDTY